MFLQTTPGRGQWFSSPLKFSVSLNLTAQGSELCFTASATQSFSHTTIKSLAHQHWKRLWRALPVLVGEVLCPWAVWDCPLYETFGNWTGCDLRKGPALLTQNRISGIGGRRGGKCISASSHPRAIGSHCLAPFIFTQVLSEKHCPPPSFWHNSVHSGLGMSFLFSLTLSNEEENLLNTVSASKSAIFTSPKVS